MRYIYGRDGKALSGTTESAVSVSSIEREIVRMLAAFDRNAWLAGADSGIEAEDELRASILKFESAAQEVRETIAKRLGRPDGGESSADDESE